MKNYILSFLLVFAIIPAMAQKGLVRKGDFHYKLMAYPKAIPYYTKAIKRQHLTGSYLQTGRLLQADQ
ncbi:MAG: hypothetical protein IPM91_07780 [Bacteroidetes bacterium]|nr:hypothetical protein [Bacteroidota bacterium]